MEDYLGENAPARLPGRKYAQSEASEKISEASGAPREGLEGVDGTGGEAPVYQKNKQMFCKLRGLCEDTVGCQRLRRTQEMEKKHYRITARSP